MPLTRLLLKHSLRSGRPITKHSPLKNRSRYRRRPPTTASGHRSSGANRAATGTSRQGTDIRGVFNSLTPPGERSVVVSMRRGRRRRHLSSRSPSLRRCSTARAGELGQLVAARQGIVSSCQDRVGKCTDQPNQWSCRPPRPVLALCIYRWSSRSKAAVKISMTSSPTSRDGGGRRARIVVPRKFESLNRPLAHASRVLLPLVSQRQFSGE